MDHMLAAPPADGTRSHAHPPKELTMNGNDQLAIIIPMLREVAAGIDHGQLDGSHPVRRLRRRRGCSVT